MRCFCNSFIGNCHPFSVSSCTVKSCLLNLAGSTPSEKLRFCRTCLSTSSRFGWPLSVVAFPDMNFDKTQLCVRQWAVLNVPNSTDRQQTLLSSRKSASKTGILNSRGENKTQDREYQRPIDQWGWKMHICSPENTSFTGTCPRCIYHLHSHGSRY